MAHTKAYNTKLERDKLYHILNRTVGDEMLFRTEDNYRFFLKKHEFFLSESVETIAYCLLPNHFHFFIRIIDEKSASTNFRRFFQSYSLAYNRSFKRRGTLLERPYKRKEVRKSKYISRLIRYIHQNPQKHALIDDFRKWKWSSFHEQYGDLPNRITSRFVEDWFLSKAEFKSFHEFLETESSME